MKLEINIKSKAGKSKNVEIKQHIPEQPLAQRKKKKKTHKWKWKHIYQNLWETEKAVLRGKFIAINAHIKKGKISQVNNITIHLKEQEQQQN